MKASHYFFTIGGVTVFPFQSLGFRARKETRSKRLTWYEVHFLTAIIMIPA
jgi:hypothetical protein